MLSSSYFFFPFLPLLSSPSSLFLIYFPSKVWRVFCIHGQSPCLYLPLLQSIYPPSSPTKEHPGTKPHGLDVSGALFLEVHYPPGLFCSTHLSWVSFSSVQSLSRVRLFVTPWAAAHQASLSITNSRSLFKHLSIESVMPSNHLILCHPLLLLPPVFPSIRVFSNESALCIRWPKYWSFSFSISPSSEYSGLISFRMDWLGLLAVQGTLKSLLQHHSSKASILWRSAFFIVQLSHP